MRPRLLALLAAAAATPWPRDASQVVHDRYDIIFCHPPAGRSLNDRVAKLVAQKPPHKRCYARAPNRTQPIVSQPAPERERGARALTMKALPAHPTFWVPLRFATKADALTAVCTFANVTVPLLQRADHVASYTLLTLPYPTGEHGSPWDRAYAKHGHAGCAPALLEMLADDSKLSAWFVMDHDSAIEDARNSTKGKPELHETWVASPKLRHVPMGVSRRSPAFAAALASRNVPFHARNGSVYVNFRVHGLNRATAKSVVQKNFGVKNAYYGGTDETYFADLLANALRRVAARVQDRLPPALGSFGARGGAHRPRLAADARAVLWIACSFVGVVGRADARFVAGAPEGSQSRRDARRRLRLGPALDRAVADGGRGGAALRAVVRRRRSLAPRGPRGPRLRVGRREPGLALQGPRRGLERCCCCVYLCVRGHVPGVAPGGPGLPGAGLAVRGRIGLDRMAYKRDRCARCRARVHHRPDAHPQPPRPCGFGRCPASWLLTTKNWTSRSWITTSTTSPVRSLARACGAAGERRSAQR